MTQHPYTGIGLVGCAVSPLQRSVPSGSVQTCRCVVVRKICRSAIIFLYVIFAGSSIASDLGPLDSVRFENFGEVVDVVYAAGRYINKEKDLTLAFNNQLIIKAKKQVIVEQVRQWRSQFKNERIVYEGRDFNFFVVEYRRSGNVSKLIAGLAGRDEVLGVQPDILQIHRKAGLRLTQLTEPGLVDVHQNPLSMVNASTVNVAIIDDGFDFTHTALQGINVIFQYDTSSRSLDARPRRPEDTHGTLVAGVMFAQKDVSPGSSSESNLIAIRQPDTWTSNALLALQLAKLAGADVVNCSWNSQWLMEPVRDAVVDLATHGREGKGMPIVFSAGNEGREIQPLELEAGIPEAIVVGANSRTGGRAPYSNYGETVDLYVTNPVVNSTAVGGGFRHFSGTSLSAAIVTRRIADLLELNPDLTLDAIQTWLKRDR